MSTALDLDPYLLPSPTPDSLVIRPDLAGTLRTGYDTRYTDMIWPLGPLTDNPSAHSLSIHWDCCPAVLRNELRLVTWNMINGQLRPAFLADRGPRMRGRVSSYYLAETIRQWMGLARWLDDRGVSTLAACDASVLHAYGLHLRAKHSRNQMKKTLLALTRLWAFDQLGVHPVRIGRPPWEDQGIDDYLPAATEVGGENATEPLAEQTMGPLLIWAMRMVDEFADDILAGWAERQRLVELASTTSGTPAGRAALHAYLGPLVEAGAQLPTTTIRNDAGLARFYIAGVTGSSLSQVDGFRNSLIRRGWRLSTLSVTATLQPATCPLNVPVNGRIAGRLWRKAMDFNEVLPLMRYLGTAAFVVCAYLTGMRTGEILGLRSGCCPDPEPDADGKAGRHLIRSREYKAATDEHGNHQSAGIERDVPWVAIAPVVNAIRVLERIVPHGHLLFDHNAHDLFNGRPGAGSLKATDMRRRIEEFVSWANEEASTHHLAGQTIPPDPNGKIGTSRFRRSLAWHIARRPNGLVALAVQYGHLRTTVSGGYASRGRGGIHELIDMETARAVADTVADLHDDLETGGGVSGPAAQRAIRAAAAAPTFVGTVITAASARRLLANEDAMLRERADALDTRAAHTPGPLADRLHTNADRLRSYADGHDHNRITLNEEAG